MTCSLVRWPMVLLTGLMFWPSSAHACSQQRSVGLEVRPLWSASIHEDGVLSWEVTDYDGDATDALDLLSFDVGGLDGEIDLIATGLPGTALVVWRPSSTLEPGPREAEVTVDEVDGEPEQNLTHPFEVLPSSSGPLELGPLRPRIVLSPYSTAEGERLCCTLTEDFCGVEMTFEQCTTTETVRHPGLEYEAPITGASPYAVIRDLSVIGDGSEPAWTPWRAPRPEPTLVQISSEAAEYCAQVEVMDLRDGSVTSTEACVPHEQLPSERTEIDLDQFVADSCRGHSAYWESSGELYDDTLGCSVGTRGSNGLLSSFALLLLGLWGRTRRK